MARVSGGFNLDCMQGQVFGVYLRRLRSGQGSGARSATWEPKLLRTEDA